MSADTLPVEATKVSRRRRWVTWAAVVLLLAGLVTVGWFWRHPTVFPEAGNAVGHSQLPLDTRAYVGISYEEPDARGTITIHSVRANVVTDTAGANIEFFVCTVSDAGGGIGLVFESGVREFCDSLVPATGATLELNAKPRQEVVMAVGLDRAGRVEVHGVDVNYSHGWQSGSQRIGPDVSLRHRGR